VVVSGGGLAFDRDGEIVETSPARDHAISSVATCLAAKGGAAIVIDYGHERATPGDTLQAVRGHRFAPVLAHPGEQDLTAHVDFQAVAEAATDAGAEVTPLVAQGEWLIRLGIEARAQALSRANPQRANDLQIAFERLTSRDQMGQLFKVIAMHSPDWPVPAGFA
jgi:SAM-dependent MidA family methyltransferase